MSDRLTVAEAAKLLGLCAWSVRRLIIEGKLPAEKFGRAYVIRRADLTRLRRNPPGRPKGKA